MYEKQVKQQEKAKKKVAKEQAKLDKAQDDRCFPIVKEYFKLLANHELKLGATEFEEKYEYARPIVNEFLELCLEANLKVSDLKYIDQLIKKVHGDITETVFDSINRSLSICVKEYWGCDDRDKDFKMIDEKLKVIADKKS